MPRRLVPVGVALALLAAIAGAIISACYDIPRPACGFVCGPDGACPDGYQCASDHHCHRDGTSPSLVCSSPDAALPVDATPDGMPDGTGGIDAGADAAVDAVPDAVDAAPDAVDAAPDAVDAAPDAPDAAPDAPTAPDAAADAAPDVIDAAPDAPDDAAADAPP